MIPPTLGRATACFGDHPTLHRALHRLRDLSAALDDEEGLPSAERCRLMEKLLARMHAHFAAEEADYFSTLVDACPGFRGRVATLAREHGALLHAAQWLRAAFDRNARGDEVHVKLNEFIALFDRHEAEETLLLRDFLVEKHAKDEGDLDD